MQLLKLLATTALVLTNSLTTAAPIDSVNSEGIQAGTDDAPMCGYVRITPYDGFIVGFFATATCEPIFHGKEASVYSMDRDPCGCRFYATEQDCKSRVNVPTVFGPTWNESPFTGTKPKYVFCEKV